MSERLLIRNGRLLDPSSGRDEILDVAIADGKIVGLAPHIDASGYHVIDATGALVVPGLVDIHTHAYWGGTLLGVNADKVGPRSGVTTWVDCGSSGAATFEGFFHHVIKPSRLRIIPFINLSYIGLTQAGNLSIDVGELFDWRFADLRELRRVRAEYGSVIAGVKLRASNNACGANGPVVLPLAREAANILEVPLMIHIGNAPPIIDEVLPYLKAGDILTHIYNPSVGGCVLDQRMRLRPSVREALARGVKMDLGHGGASFSFEVAQAAIEEGLLPDAISTDIYAHNIEGVVKDLPHIMAKFLSLGFSLEQVIRLTTCSPADILGRPDLGRVELGGEADLAVFHVRHDPVQVHDSLGVGREAPTTLECALTLCRGQIIDMLDDGRAEGRTYSSDQSRKGRDRGDRK
ncbi:amidohydrolase/deacetylase family metallohydrolase [Microvirga terrae]|uniref:Amidohydrolase/deacetylase family metallohydrolase n=1 Tax=Microvirga terrae TaxID=2740529 RepID=A0ABY5RZG2_9HYPH|nr:amidohydrolase/deacetylase family metallohydrolase [Microvirga terrae]UVF21567.1 amidohydrolase/deacetylase family metallohydrolase [Microvirga terrae]